MTVGVRLRLTVPSEVRSVGLVGQIVRAIAASAGPDGRLPLELVELAVGEGVANAVVHAHGRNPERPIVVEVDCADGLLTVAVHDRGPGFVLPASLEPADPLAEGGRGLFLIRTLMDEVEYRREPGGNVLRLVKRLT